MHLEILELRTKIFDLNLKEIERGCFNNIKELKALDFELNMLMKSITKYDFISKINTGNTLLVGEGNLSFTISLVKKITSLLPKLITSTYENYEELPEGAQFNAKLLTQAGIKVLHGLDATKLHKIFNATSFNTIIFQFPHSGSREGVNGVNANYILVRNFIISALQILKRHGIVLITIVDSDFYNGIFRFNELAEGLGVELPIKYRFDPKDYPEYEHSMTH